MYQGLDAFDKAKQYYEDAYNIQLTKNFQPKHGALLYMKYAQFLLLYDNPKKAKVITKEAIDDYPNTAAFWVMLALIEQKIGNSHEALKAAAQAKLLISNEWTEGVYEYISRNEPVPFSDTSKLAAWMVYSVPSVLP